MMKKVKSLLRLVPEVGLVYALQQVKWTLIPDWLVEFNIWDASATDISHLADLTTHDPALRWATPADAPRLAAFDIKPETLTDAFGKTVRIVICEDGDRIVGYGQYAIDHWDQSDWIRFRIRDDEFLGAGIWVDPDFRGRGLGTQIMNFGWSEMVRSGRHRTVGIVNRLNRNMKQATAKVAKVRYEPIFVVRFLGITYYRYGNRRQLGCWTPRNRLTMTF